MTIQNEWDLADADNKAAKEEMTCKVCGYRVEAGSFCGKDCLKVWLAEIGMIRRAAGGPK